MNRQNPADRRVLEYEPPRRGIPWSTVGIVIVCVLAAAALFLIWGAIEFGRQLPNQQ